MLDRVYQTVLTLLSKDLQGNVTPVEFNRLAKLAQDEIFRGYFEDENRDKNRQNKGLTNRGYSNLSFNQRQRIQPFKEGEIVLASGLFPTGNSFDLPTNLYMLEDNGVSTTDGILIEEVPSNSIVTLRNTSVAPSATYPVYESYNTGITVSPNTIISIDVRYIRKPLDPNWTYTVVGNNPLFNPASVDYQDFELTESEFTNLVVKMLGYFGVTIREADVIQVSETLDNKTMQKDNG